MADRLTNSEQSVIPRVQELTRMVEEAIDRSLEAAGAIEERNKALKRLSREVGGDLLSAIRNGQLEIGRLMTEAGDTRS